MDEVKYSAATSEMCGEWDEMAKCVGNPEYAEKRRIASLRKNVRATAERAREDVSRAAKVGLDVLVVVGNSGLTSTYRGRLVEDGEWVSLKSQGKIIQKVYNPATGKMWVGTKRKEPQGIVKVIPARHGF